MNWQQQGWRAGQLVSIDTVDGDVATTEVRVCHPDGGMACGFTLYHKTGGTCSQGHWTSGSMVVGNPRAATQEEVGRYLEALWEATK